MIKSLGMICEMGHVDRLCLRQSHGTQIIIEIAERLIFGRFVILRCIAHNHSEISLGVETKPMGCLMMISTPMGRNMESSKMSNLRIHEV